jgi:hypothetical protein
MNRFKKLLQALGDTFQSSISLDLRSLALSRIILGSVLLVDILTRLQDLTAHYTDTGVLSRQNLLDHYDMNIKWSLHLLSGDAGMQLVLFIIAAIFAVMLIIGWNTKIATIVSWILLVSVQNRIPIINDAGDVAFRLVLFWAMFLPWGTYFSVDGRKQKAKPKQHFSVGAFAFIFQLVLLYWTSVIYKSGAPWTSDYTALYFTLSLDQFTTRIGYIVYQFYDLMKVLTFMVIRYEVIGPALLLIPFFNGLIRTVGALGLMAMHAGMGLSMELGIFPLVMIGHISGILGGFFWDSLLPEFSVLIRKVIKLPARLKVNLRKAISAGDKLLAKLPINPAPKIFKKYPKLTATISDLVAGILIVYVLAWALTDLPGNTKSLIRPDQTWVAQFLRLDQKWDMFSPFPLTNDGWYLVIGKGKDGKDYDLLDAGAEATFTKPELVSADYRNQRQRNLLLNLYYINNEFHRPLYMKYMCSQWRLHPQHLHGQLKFIYMEEVTLPEYQTRPLNQVLLNSTYC